MTIGDCAKLVRSKNAGIGLITVDVVCAEPADYNAVVRTLSPARIADAYGVPALDIIRFEAGLAVKVTLPRPRIAGGYGLGETDLYGSAQYAPIAEMEIETA
jgi:hypothetical protein